LNGTGKVGGGNTITQTGKLTDEVQVRNEIEIDQLGRTRNVERQGNVMVRKGEWVAT
jgi:hypothetical protein